MVWASPSFGFRRSGGAGLLFRGGLALGVAMSVVIIFVCLVSRVSVCDANMTGTRCKLQPKRLFADFLLGGKLIDMEGVVIRTH